MTKEISKDKKDFYAWLDKQPDPLPEKRETKVCPKSSISPYSACRVFYQLIYLDHAIKKGSPEKRQLSNFKRNYDNKLAIALRDYIVLCIGGELRHSRYKIENKDVRFPFEDGDREEAMEAALNYLPDSILASALILFDPKKYEWEEYYGGTSWYRITKAAMKYGEISNEKWIDIVWDLKHNNNMLFDRSTIFHLDDNSIYEFLEDKSNEEKSWEEDGLTLQNVLSTEKKTIQTVADYNPISWGLKLFPVPLKKYCGKNESGDVIIKFIDSNER
jgi:hypothetical protein